jgi:pentatricopeptide repeat protein
MCSLLIADLAKGGGRTGLAHAEELMMEMRRRGFTVGAVTWTGLVSGYFRGGWEADGWNALRRMETSNLSLNRVCYNIILKQAGEGSIPTGAEPISIRIFRKMIEEGVEPNGDTYYITLEALMRAKRFDESAEVVRQMQVYGYEPEKNNLKRAVRHVKLKTQWVSGKSERMNLK